MLGAAITVTTLLFSVANTAFAQDAQNIVELASGTDDLSTLVTAVTEAELVGALSDPDANLTVFAPTNAAFDALPDGTLDQLLTEEGKDDLVNILTYHVVDAEAFSGDLSDGQVLTALNGDQLTVRIEGDNVFINDAQVTTADVDASNGVVHIIDSVLLPPADESGTHNMADTGIELGSIGVFAAALIVMGLSGAGMMVYNYKRQ